MNLQLLGVAMGGLLLLAAHAPDDAKKTDDEMLLGTWTVVTTAVPPGKPRPNEGHWDFGKNKIALYRGKDFLDGHMIYAFDPSKEPKTIDLTPDLGPAKGKTLKGIYSLDGDKLKICYVAPDKENPEKVERPKSFDAEGTVVWVFERAKP